MKKRKSIYIKNFQKALKNKLALFGLICTVVLTLSAILAPVISQYEPEMMDMLNRNAPPSSVHILGTDNLGRDMMSRLLYGGRISILVGLAGALGSGIIGIILGSIAGYKGGWLDKSLLFISEIFMSFPQIILVLIMVSFVGQGLLSLIVIFVITGWTGTFRLVRARFFSLREENFVEACTAFGLKKSLIIFKYMLPNTMGPVIVSITIAIAGYMLQETGLSFLGLGVPPSIPTWGNMMNVARTFNVLQNYTWQWLPPGVPISLFVLSINFLGDGLRDAFDPKQ